MSLEIVFDEQMPTHMVMTTTDGDNVRVTVSPQVEEAALEVLNSELVLTVTWLS
jgi:hypothetical protein